MDIKLKQNHVNIAMKTTGGVGTKDHAKLNNLDYEHSGHTGFASDEQIQELLDLLNNKQDTLIAGDNISIVNNIISVTGFTKNEIYIGPDKPTDPNIKIWIDTNEVAQEFYTKQEIDAKNFATEGWVSAQGYLTQHQDLSEYAKKSEIPTKVSAFENDAGYLTQHQDLSGYALKTEIPTVPTNVSAFNNDAGYLTEHQSLENYALKTELPTEYVKSASVQGNKLTLTNKDNTTVDFEPSGGGSGGGTSYIFTDGLTETDGVVSLDLFSKRLKPYNNSVGIGSFKQANNPTFNNTGYNNLVVGASEGNYSTYPMFQCDGSDGSILFGRVKAYNANIGAKIYVQTSDNGGSLAGGLVNCYKNTGGIDLKGEGSVVIGRATDATLGCYGEGNIVIGCADKNSNMIAGDSVISANSCQAFGSGVQVFGYNSMVQGKHNILDRKSPNTYAHIVGNGTSDTSRSNAYTLDWQGNGTFAGTVSSSTGADYAEYFEWKDGNPNNEDRVGYIVTLDGDKIVKANTGDDILGICSGTAMVLGDSAEWNWSKRYLTDDFGRIIYEDYDVEHEEIKDENTGKVIEEAWTEHIHAPKQNPEYNASQPYAKRADRPEWQIVGMMGKIYVRDDGSCIVNGYADVKDGIATKANGKTNMRVMDRVSDNIVRILMK